MSGLFTRLIAGAQTVVARSIRVISPQVNYLLDGANQCSAGDAHQGTGQECVAVIPALRTVIDAHRHSGWFLAGHELF